jgi:hypothetical protein
MHMGPAPAAVVRATEEPDGATTWPWLGRAEQAINDFFDPIANAVAAVIF